MADDVVKPDVLKAYLLYCLLEFDVIKYLKCVAIDKEHGISFNLSVT